MSNKLFKKSPKTAALAAEPEKVIDEVKSRFKVGVAKEENFRFIGVDISTVRESAKSFSIHLAQRGVLDDVQTIESNSLNPVGEMRSVLGSLQWLGGSTRPDLLAGISLELQNLDSVQRVNKLLRQARAYEDHVIVYRKLNLQDGQVNMMAFSDASWRNHKDCRSQEGGVIALASSIGSRDSNEFNAFAWFSRKNPRIARSSTAAEVLAACDTLDNVLFASEILKFMGLKTTLSLFSDSKNVIQRTLHPNPAPNGEKMLILYFEILKEFSAKGVKFHFCSAKDQLADVLTKSRASPSKILEVLRSGILIRREEKGEGESGREEEEREEEGLM